MEAELVFDLDNPDDVMAHRRCIMALEMAIALWDIKQLTFKEGDIKAEQIYEIMENINLDNLIA